MFNKLVSGLAGSITAGFTCFSVSVSPERLVGAFSTSKSKQNHLNTAIKQHTLQVERAHSEYLTACDSLKKAKEQRRSQSSTVKADQPIFDYNTRHKATGKLDLLRKEVDKAYYTYLGHKDSLQEAINKNRDLDDPLAVRLFEQQQAFESFWRGEVLSGPTVETPRWPASAANDSQAAPLKGRSVRLFDLSPAINFTADNLLENFEIHDRLSNL